MSDVENVSHFSYGRHINLICDILRGYSCIQELGKTWEGGLDVVIIRYMYVN